MKTTFQAISCCTDNTVLSRHDLGCKFADEIQIPRCAQRLNGYAFSLLSNPKLNDPVLFKTEFGGFWDKSCKLIVSSTVIFLWAFHQLATGPGNNRKIGLHAVFHGWMPTVKKMLTICYRKENNSNNAIKETPTWAHTLVSTLTWEQSGVKILPFPLLYFWIEIKAEK